MCDHDRASPASRSSRGAASRRSAAHGSSAAPGSSPKSRVTTTPTRIETITVFCAPTTSAVVGSPIPSASKQRPRSPVATSSPPSSPVTPADQPDHRGLEEDRGEDLAPRGAEGAQHPKLADPLGHDDREGVGDDEGADDQRHGGEDAEEDRQEAERVVISSDWRLAFCSAVSTPDLPGGTTCFIRCAQLRRRGAGAVGDRDLVEAPDVVGDPAGPRAGRAGRSPHRRSRRPRAR